VPESQRFLQAALDALSAHIAVLDADGTILAVNAAWRRFAEANGFAGARFGVGANYVTVCEEAGHGGVCDDSRVAAAGIRAVAAGTVERFVMDYPCHAPGEQRWFQLTVTRFAEPSPARLVVAHENITARTLAEQALRDSEHKLRLALEAADMGIWEWHKDGTRIVSDNYAQVVGAAPLTNETFLDLVHPADRNDLLRCLQVALRETGVYRCEYRVVPPDGGERWIAGYGRVLRDESGEPDHMIGIVMDVTARRRDDLQREESRRTMQLALEVARAGAWSWRVADDRVTGDANLARLFRVPADDLSAGRIASSELFAAVHPDDVSSVVERMREALDRGGDYETQLRVVGADGRVTWLSSRGMVRAGRDGRAESVAGLVFDITQQKQLELDAAFLAEVGECIRLAEDAGTLVSGVADMLARHLGGVRSVFAQADGTPGGWTLHEETATDLAGRPGEALPYPPALVADLAAGRTVVVGDTRSDARTRGLRDEAPPELRRIHAFVVVPELRDGRWTLVHAVLSEAPRAWTAREVSLVETVTERTWNAVEKLRLDQRLRESEQRYRSLVRVTTAVVVVTDRDGCIVTPQPDWERYTGQTFAESSGRGYLDALHPEDFAAAASAWDDARRRRVIIEYEARLRHAPSGAYRYCIGRAVPVFASDGAVREWVMSIVDVDEQRRAEMLLRASEAEWRLVFESAREYAIFTIDLERRITRWNAGATRLLGYDESEIVGRIGDVLFTPADRAAGIPEGEVATALRAGRSEDERWHVRKDGSRFWASGLMMPLESERGATIGFVKIMRDMTASKRAEEEREELLRIAQQARTEAESASRAKDDFLATLSHELRSPLQAAVGWVTLLRSGSLSPEQRTKAVATLERSIRHQVQLVNDLLDVSRILTGKLYLETSLVDLGLVVEQVREEFQVEARSRGLELSLAAATECGMVLGDPQRLGQIFRNLISNALKFTPSGGRVSISCAHDADAVVVEVADTGQGIARDFLPHVFDRFSQADTSITRQHGGLGLGLGIVRHLVDLHGGSVEAESPGVGRGTTFRVRLPVATTPVWSDAAGPPATLTPARNDTVEPGIEGVRVFVVEDEALTRDALALALQQAGARVTVTAGAREALDLLPVAEPDVILTDLGMPGEDGFWLAQRVRAARLDVPIIALTGFADAETRSRVERAGMQAHVTKPVDLPLLVATVRAVLAPRAPVPRKGRRSNGARSG
jgi:PAS domain S-box-containing protein